MRYLYQNGKEKALTFSYDDGVCADSHLIEIFDKYGIKATFHLNSGLFGKGNRGKADAVKELYKNHEVAVHGVLHKTLTVTPGPDKIKEVLEDRCALERLVGYPVRGMSYANGAFNADVCAALKTCGIVYSRTIQATYQFGLPDDFLMWHPTCHHKECMPYVERFLEWNHVRLSLLYIWGHAYEFDNKNNWDLIEEVCRKLSGQDNIWYATNMEIYNYINALKNLNVSVDESVIQNPSAVDVWVMIDDEKVCIKGGETKVLK